MLAISPKTFEDYGITIDHVFLLDYLSEEGGQYYIFKGFLDEIGKDLLTEFFGKKLANHLLEDDPIDISRLQEEGGVLIVADCAHPDPEKVDFDANGEVLGWAWAKDKALLHVYEQNLDEALIRPVKNAQTIEEAYLKVARENFQARLKEHV